MRQVSYQTVSWFWDLKNRNLLEMNPPYQRRSVWNQEYKEYFIDTILHNYPCPSIFLYQEISPEGISTYSIVDGKQRLFSIFGFIENEFSVGETSSLESLRNKYFKDFEPSTKLDFWKYQLPVEYLSSNEALVINDIFDRINRNISKLTPQELRHARFSGEFMKATEEESSWMLKILPKNFPRFEERSIRQMKDVEFVAQLLLLLEKGPTSHSQDELDEAYLTRDRFWEEKDEIIDSFRKTILLLKEVCSLSDGVLEKTRMKNQADFYSLFGAISDLYYEIVNEKEKASQRLVRFAKKIEDEKELGPLSEPILFHYAQSVQSSSNNTVPRKKRIAILKSVLQNVSWEPS